MGKGEGRELGRGKSKQSRGEGKSRISASGEMKARGKEVGEER